jgi:hypothetical protein
MEVPRSLFRPDSHLTVEAVALYVDALKLERMHQLPQPVLEHVEKCERCKGEVTGLFSLLAGEDYSKVTPHPFLNETGNAMPRPVLIFLRIAAVIVAVIGFSALVAVLFLQNNGNDTVTPAVTAGAQGDTSSSQGLTEAGTKKKEEPRKSIASRFVESPELEDLMRGSLRSAETEVPSPEDGAIVRAGSFFKWATSAHPPFELTILDNRGFSVRSFTVQSSEFRMEDSLQAGLYYWKLVAESNLLHVGKFTVQQVLKR